MLLVFSLFRLHCIMAQQCQSMTDCDECLANDCAWAVGMCLSSCNEIADAACYTTNPNRNASQTCEVAATDRADGSLCGDKIGCSECVETIKSNGESCEWYAPTRSTSYCGTGGCDMIACGSRDCGASSTWQVFSFGSLVLLIAAGAAFVVV